MSARTQLAIPEWRKPVVAVPLTQAFPQFQEVKEFKSKVCLFSHDRTRVFDVVSNKYQVIDHGRAIDTVTTALADYFNEPNIKSDVRSLQGGARVIANFKLPVPMVQVKKGDLCGITISLRNSYDRAWPFSAVLGALRLICTNGMTASTAFGSIKARHVGLAAEDDIIESLDGMVKNIPLLQETWKEWLDIKVTHKEAVNLLANEFPDKYLAPVLDPSHYPRSKWDLYNDLTRFATHDTKSIQRRVDFDDKISSLFYADIEDGELVN